MPAIRYRIIPALAFLLWCSSPLALEGAAEPPPTPAAVANGASAEAATTMERLTLLRPGDAVRPGAQVDRRHHEHQLRHGLLCC